MPTARSVAEPLSGLVRGLWCGVDPTALNLRVAVRIPCAAPKRAWARRSPTPDRTAPSASGDAGR